MGGSNLQVLPAGCPTVISNALLPSIDGQMKITLFRGGCQGENCLLPKPSVFRLRSALPASLSIIH